MANIRSNIKEAKNNKNQRGRLHKFIMRGLILSIVGVLSAGYILYSYILKANTQSANPAGTEIYISSNSTFEQVKDSLTKYNVLINPESFEWVAKKKGYNTRVRGGRYIIEANWSNNDLVNYLRIGNQTPVKLTFNNIDDLEELSQVIGSQIEANPQEILSAAQDTNLLKELKILNEQEELLFLPDTYFMYWTTDAKEFMQRMAKESRSFWNPKRLEKANAIGLTPFEVVTLASIVQKESNIAKEQPIIASVYLNRLKRGVRLQADPTVVFAHKAGNDTIRRILHKHLKLDSPYNTYIYAGLPPGPICYPSKATIEAVLNAPQTKYMYFCADDSLNGTHIFAKTLRQHNRNAAKYRRALNKMKIFK